MRKKIYTFTFILVAILLSLYFVWAIAANIQKESFKRYLSEEWSLKLNDRQFTVNGFPFRFGMKVSNFQSPLKNTALSLQFLKLEIVRLIYNFSDLILFVEKPVIISTHYPKFSSSANRLKVSISNRPFSGRFKLITKQEDWQISNDSFIKSFEAKEVVFALKDVHKKKLRFYLQANDLRSSFLNTIQQNDPEKPNKLVLEGTISSSFIREPKTPHKTIKLESMMLEKIDINIGVLELACNDMTAINIKQLTTEGDVDCLLRLSSREISQIKTDNDLINSILELINLIQIIKNPSGTAETQAVPFKFSLDRGLLYINAIPIYQFPKQN